MSYKWRRLELEDKDASKLRKSLLKTCEAVAVVATQAALMQKPSELKIFSTQDHAKYWLEAFEPSRGQKELAGLSNAQAFVVLECLRAAQTDLTQVGQYNEPFEETHADLQTQRIAEAGNSILTTAPKVRQIFNARLQGTTPFDLIQACAEEVRNKTASTAFEVVVKELARRADLVTLGGGDSAIIVEELAQKLASNALSSLEAPAVQHHLGTRDEVLAPLVFKAVRDLFAHDFFKERAAHS